MTTRVYSTKCFNIISKYVRRASKIIGRFPIILFNNHNPRVSQCSILGTIFDWKYHTIYNASNYSSYMSAQNRYIFVTGKRFDNFKFCAQNVREAHLNLKGGWQHTWGCLHIHCLQCNTPPPHPDNELVQETTHPRTPTLQRSVNMIDWLKRPTSKGFKIYYIK